MGRYSHILLFCLIVGGNILESDAECDQTAVVKCTFTETDINKVCGALSVYKTCLTDAGCPTEKAVENILDRFQVKCEGGEASQHKCSDEYPVSFGPVRNPHTFWDSNILTERCKSPNFKKQVGCLIDDERSLKDAEFKSLIAEGDDYVSAVDTLCGNLKELDIRCTTSIVQCLNNEAQTKLTSTDYTTEKKYTCKLYENYLSCIEPKTGEATCNHPKTKDVLKTVHGKLVPPACGSSALFVTYILVISSIWVSMFM